MYVLGIDLGTSSIKVSVVDAASQQTLVSVQYPEVEAEIISPLPGWAEQDPERWWAHTQAAIRKAHATGLYNPQEIQAIGIAYQMHGLVLVDKDQQVLRNAIIWCDSRAVALGEQAFEDIGQEHCLSTFLNSPGNFTAAKLAWVKQQEPAIYAQVHKFMLPGDFIAMKLTGEISSTISSLSEGVFWDFKNNQLATEIFQYYDFDPSIFPAIHDVFSEHGKIRTEVAEQLGLSAAVTVNYKAGDQPNNALSLNVMQPGEVAATAGTSGVIYGVSDSLVYDQQSRINTFAHVNYKPDNIRTGVLLCINGTGSMNSWAKRIMGQGLDYPSINKLAEKQPIDGDGLQVIPFGNGAERMLNNKLVGAHIEGLDLNRHGSAQLFRAVQQGIAFAFRYGLDIMRENGLQPKVIRAGYANLFLSPVFQEAFTGVTGVPIELYANDGSVGAAMGAAIGVGYFQSEKEAFSKLQKINAVEPQFQQAYEEQYQQWKQLLNQKIN